MKQQEKNGTINQQTKKIINNLKMFYKAKEKVITLFDDYTRIVFKTKYETKHGKGRLNYASQNVKP